MTNANITATRSAVTRGHAREALPLKDGSEASRVPRAVIYLRVSTPSQVKTDYNPEGISLPAQRDACQIKCAQLGAEIAREFIEPGRTATSIDKRVVFQEMMAWIKANKDDIDYVVVYHFNRIFRNSIDAAITKRDLKKWGVRIVSTILDLGEGPESDMVETIVGAVDEYRVKADAADITYKMGAKAKNGGTIGRARLGFVNARDFSEGRNVGIVKVDPERAPLIVAAFELYATGDFSLESLREELTLRGLTTRPGRFPACPISVSKLAELLRDTYYLGYVNYKGEQFPGRHEALISHELFDQVQLVLNNRGGNGRRQRRHDHYLKGSLWCGYCHDQGVESRMILNWANGHGGRYLYFFCVNKAEHPSGPRYADGDKIEAAAEDFYAFVRFPADLAQLLRQRMIETMAEERKASKLLNEQLRAEINRLNTQEENLLDLAADGELDTGKVKQRLAVIQRKRDQATERLGNGDERLEIGINLIENALKLLADPQRLYRKFAPAQRQLMNQAIFEKLYVHQDGKIGGAIFRPPFYELLEARDAAAQLMLGPGSTHLRSVDQRGEPTAAADLPTSFFVGGSNKRVMVEVSGLEPPTSTLRTWRSTS